MALETFLVRDLACWFLDDCEKLTPNDMSLFICSRSDLIDVRSGVYGFFFTFAASALAFSALAISDSVGVCGLSSGRVEINSCP